MKNVSRAKFLEFFDEFLFKKNYKMKVQSISKDTDVFEYYDSDGNLLCKKITNGSRNKYFINK